MKMFLICFVTFFLLLFSGGYTTARSAGFPKWDLLTYWFGKNKYDKEGLYHGKWTFFYDDNTTVMRKGKFKHGQQVRKWMYYLADGTRYRREKYRRANDEVHTTLFHPNGKVAVKGVAQYYENATKIHYYWQGDWKYYTEDGKFLKTVFYSKGKAQQVKSTAGVEEQAK